MKRTVEFKLPSFIIMIIIIGYGCFTAYAHGERKYEEGYEDGYYAEFDINEFVLSTHKQLHEILQDSSDQDDAPVPICGSSHCPLESFVVERDDDCMASKVLAADGTLLPIGKKAFLSPDAEEFLRYETGFSNYKAFYKSFGIKIGKRSDTAGWYECKLPDGWSVELLTDPSSSYEYVIFHKPDGSEPFYLRTSKDDAKTRATLAFYAMH